MRGRRRRRQPFGELREETGYEGKVLDCSPTIVADPGLTTANMQVCFVIHDVR